jgi:hypothetical protein
VAYVITARQAAGVIVAALLIVLAAGLITHATEPSAPARIPACTAEDSPGAASGPCYWNARTRGNHHGHSFTAPTERTTP